MDVILVSGWTFAILFFGMAQHIFRKEPKVGLELPFLISFFASFLVTLIYMTVKWAMS